MRQLFSVCSVAVIISQVHHDLLSAYAYSSSADRAGSTSGQAKPQSIPFTPSITTSQSQSSLERARKVTQRAATQISKRQKFLIPKRPLAPPFPDGLNNGRIVTLPPSDHYLIDSNLSGNPLILPPRDITVWLPPDYDRYPTMEFPVLYVHDGQNAIQDSSSWTGSSWRLAGALTRLSERKLLTKTTSTHSPPILVLMPCCTDNVLFVPRRHLEYGDTSQVFAQAHADFVAKTLKPLIDSKFRTLSDVDNTAVIGSSLGGQASLHLCLRHPDLFGSAACMSPAFQASILASVATLPESTFVNKTIYLDNGGDDEDVKVPMLDVQDHLTSTHSLNPGYFWLDSQLQVSIDAMKFALDARRVKYDYRKIAGGRHNERAWGSRIHLPLLSLYGESSLQEGREEEEDDIQ